MRGVLITVDAVLAILLLSALLALSMHTASYFIDATASHTRLEVLRSKAEHAVNVLLYGEDNSFRCYYGALPVPLCVWDNGADSSLFWVGEKPDCYVVSKNLVIAHQLALMLGCVSGTFLLVEPEIVLYEGDFVYSTSFRVCYADSLSKDDVKNCTWADVNLYVWV